MDSKETLTNVIIITDSLLQFACESIENVST